MFSGIVPAMQPTITPLVISKIDHSGLLPHLFEEPSDIPLRIKIGGPSGPVEIVQRSDIRLQLSEPTWTKPQVDQRAHTGGFSRDRASQPHAPAGSAWLSRNQKRGERPRITLIPLIKKLLKNGKMNCPASNMSLLLISVIREICRLPFHFVSPT